MSDEPRRIKLVVSDFHLGSGRVGHDGQINEADDFVSDQAFIDLMEYYRTGEFVDAEVELILNGDIFECLALVDPLDPEPHIITATKSLKIVETILDGHKEMFTALRTFAAGEKRQVTFLVGNHDQDLFFKPVQELVRSRLHESVRFVEGAYRFDGVHVEHGNQHDHHNKWEEKRIFLTRGLQEPALNLPWGSDLYLMCMLKLKRLRPYVNRVRPFRLAVWWSLFHDFRVLMRGVGAFIVALFKARFRSIRDMRITFLRSMRMLFGISVYPTLEGAARKVMRADESIHTVVFGHSHIPMMRHVLPGRVYLNSGAWIPTSNMHISTLGYSLQQTYVYIEYQNDAPRAKLKLWHGRRVVEEDVFL